MARLVEIAGYTPGREIQVNEELVLGRDPGTGGLVIANREASRRHARIYLQGDTWLIEDLNSANGTFVDGVRRDQATLLEGTVLTIGRTTFRMVLQDHISRPAVSPTARTADNRVVVAQSPTPEQVIPAGFEPPRPAPSPRPALRSSPIWNMTIDARSTGLQAPGAADPDNLRRERDILNILFEISRTIGSILHLPDLVQSVLSKLFELFPVAENASIHQLEAGGLVPLAARSRGGGAITAPVISNTISSLALTNRQSILSTDAAEDARFLDKESIIFQNVRSFMCAPLLFREEPLGVLYVDTTDARPRFTADDLHLFTAVSAQISVAIKNSQLMAENLRAAEVRLHLSRYLPPDLVEQVLNHQIDLNPGGSLYQGTVLFSDVVGFTPMAERLGPERLVQTLNRYFKYMVASIFKFGGSVNQFGGDSIMALWGVPVRRGNDALHAVRAAVDMQTRIFAFNTTSLEGRSHPLKAGIGLNTGRFVVGNIGSEQHMEYTALGTDVNLAQRVESQAAGWQVFLAASCYERVAGDTSVFALPPRTLKGVASPLPIYSVRAVRDGNQILCCVPAELSAFDELVTSAMVVRVLPNGYLEIWCGVPLLEGIEIELRLDPPEHPNLAWLTGRLLSCRIIEDFGNEGGSDGYRLVVEPDERLPDLLRPPTVLPPDRERGYLLRE